MKTRLSWLDLGLVSDFTSGLANITDAEYSAHYEQMVTALQALVDSGQVLSGTVARLETVPVSFLRKVPLLEDIWLDRYVVELAQYGSLLRAKGYEISEDQDEHPLASVQFVSHDGKEIDQAETQSLRRRALRVLARFPGRRREIDGRPYLHFEDYRCWRGRKVKGDPQSEIQRGFVTTSWNIWVDAKGGEGVAALADVPVDELGCYPEPRYETFPDSEYRLGQRQRLLDDMRFCISSCEMKAVRLKEWKECAQVFLAGLYAFQEAVGFISRRYFDGAVENSCTNVVECLVTNTVGMAGLSLSKAPILSY